MTPLRALLRDATQADHQRLDAALSPTNFDDSTSYAGFLRAQAGPLFAIETALEQAQVASRVPDWAQRRRREAMRADLARLDARVDETPLAPGFEGVAAQFGALYVLEGSRLGGAFLLKRAAASADARVRDATAFLGHGAGLRLWPSFVEALEASSDARADVDALVLGARSAFALFARSVADADTL